MDAGITACGDHVQVVEILLEFLDKRDWGAALDKVIPLRKRAADDSADGGDETKRAKSEVPGGSAVKHGAQGAQPCDPSVKLEDK